MRTTRPTANATRTSPRARGATGARAVTSGRPRRRSEMADSKDVDELSGIDTTGHEWDGVKELNNPLPKWWLWVFYASIAFAVLYMFAYPAIPLISSSTTGL